MPIKLLRSLLWMFFLTQGRLGRRACNLAWFFNIVVFGTFMNKIGLPELMELTKTDAGQPKFAEQHLLLTAIGFLSVLFVMGWPGFALNIKRLHDCGKSGLLTVVPFLLLLLFHSALPIGKHWLLVSFGTSQPVLLMLLTFFRGDEGDNPYGKPYEGIGS
jgi:uncharacterized membrane protein YhaH (DUF805 family)